MKRANQVRFIVTRTARQRLINAFIEELFDRSKVKSRADVAHPVGW